MNINHNDQQQSIFHSIIQVYYSSNRNVDRVIIDKETNSKLDKKTMCMLKSTKESRALL